MQQEKQLSLPNPEHPLKKELRDHGLSQNIAAHAIEVSFQSLWKMLNGYSKMPEQVERKLEKLIQDAKAVGM